MATSTQPASKINGLLDTSQTVWSNIELLARACNTWVTYDNKESQWAFVINAPGTSVFSFNDSNLIGDVKVLNKGLRDRYTAVTVTFPHKDLVGETDFVRIEVPIVDRFSREPENELSISMNIINDPVQAQWIGFTELMQSRVQWSSTFTGDFTCNGLKAGDIVDITTDVYNFDKELFRIIEMIQVDNAADGILFKFVAVKYDPEVYNYSNLAQLNVSRKTGIANQNSSYNIASSNNQGVATSIASSVSDPSSSTTVTSGLTGAGFPLFTTEVASWSTNQVLEIYGPGTGVDGVNIFNKQDYVLPSGHYSDGIRDFMPGLMAQWTTTNPLKSMSVNVTGPQGLLNIVVDGTTKQINAGVPSSASLFFSNSESGPWIFYDTKYLEWSSYVTSFSVGPFNTTGISWVLLMAPLDTIDLSSTAMTVKIDSVDLIYPTGTGAGAGVTVQMYSN